MKHTTRAIVSWRKQWFKFPRLMIQVSDLTIMIRWNTDILTIIRREMGQLETHSPMYSMKSTGRTDFVLETHPTEYTWQAFYMFDIIKQINFSNDDNEMVYCANMET